MRDFFNRGFEAGRILDVESANRAIDLAQEPTEDFPGTDLDKNRDARFNHFVNRIEPADWMRHLSNQGVARLIAGCDGLSIYVGDHRKFERMECCGAEIRFEP